MKKLYVIAFLLTFLAGPAFGQIMKGHIYDQETNEPLAGVNITYKRLSGETDGNRLECRRFLSDQPAGRWRRLVVQLYRI